MITKYEIIFEKAKSNTDASDQKERERTNEASLDTIILWNSFPKMFLTLWSVCCFFKENANEQGTLACLAVDNVVYLILLTKG